MRKHWIAFVALAASVVAWGAVGASAQQAPAKAVATSAASVDPARRAEIEAVVRDYLIAHPEVIRDAIDALDQRQKQADSKQVAALVDDPKSKLYSSAFQAVAGNPKGDVTLVEFFDYNCPYCKASLPDMTRLVARNPRVKLILKDLPILGPGSMEAARVASAAREQLDGPKFWAFHSKLLAMRDPKGIGATQALALASASGLDVAKLKVDMASAAVDAGIKETLAMANVLGVTGTPTFVVGGETVVGAVGFDALQGKIDNVEKCGKASC
ncbi:MAG: thioredoxin domain-containing protein [Hyphomicrobiales bacterium]|nr:DsbA family protein [Hyphomicrobiales bacterium]MDE2016418.1 thioredoxin domain-containing protein [Hyphomicrobiales bacterium]